MSSRDAKECHMVSRENYYFRSLDKKVLTHIFDELQFKAQEWIGNQVRLNNWVFSF